MIYLVCSKKDMASREIEKITNFLKSVSTTFEFLIPTYSMPRKEYLRRSKTFIIILSEQVLCSTWVQQLLLNTIDVPKGEKKPLLLGIQITDKLIPEGFPVNEMKIISFKIENIRDILKNKDL